MKYIPLLLALSFNATASEPQLSASKISNQFDICPECTIDFFEGAPHTITGKVVGVILADDATTFVYEGSNIITMLANPDNTNHPRDGVLDSNLVIEDLYKADKITNLSLSCYNANTINIDDQPVLVLSDCIYVGK